MSEGFTMPAAFLGGAALVLATALMPGTAAHPGTPAPPPGAESGPLLRSEEENAGTGGATHTVTLLTGDVVEYTRTGEDATPSIAIEPAPRPSGADITFATVSDTDGGYLVLPSDVSGLVASGAVDDELFDVETLVAEGLADGNRSLPVIVRYAGDAAKAAAPRAAALPASTPTGTLESIDGVALTVRAGQADRFWAELRASARTGPTTLAGGAREIWLDRTVRAALDESVPLTGAPAAWDNGLDGSGVTVAVLDTGVDATHPDIAGRLVGTANFTDSADTSDRTGHGTHVASSVVGTGAASDGRYRGVAPGADLLVGKVLDDQGNGSTSWLIEGMEWAVGQGADVVNVSLGTRWSTDGTDPGSMAVNRLTEETDTLFVTAAGNAGDPLSISSPAVADQALAVGAVDKVTGTSLWDRSSRGPRPADAAVKPNIVAPGVGIVAARSSTAPAVPAPGNDRYTTGSGTSMATPHVTGAAAILRQQHPDWDAGEVRDALTSTARRLGHNWFEQGSGGLDIARAVTQNVFATSVVDFHRLERAAGTATRQVTYRNRGSVPVTLDLSVVTRGWSGDTAAGEPVRIGPEAGGAGSVTVPARGSVTAALTVDPAIGDSGAYGGWVTARTADGEVALTTAFSYYTGPEKHELEVSLLNSYGTSEFYGGYGPNVLIYAVPLEWPSREDPFNPPGWHVLEADNSGRAAISLPAGDYELIGKASDRFIRTRSSWVIDTVSLDTDRQVTLDARETVPLRPVLPAPVDGQGSIRYVRTFDDRPDPFTLTTGLPGDASAYHGDVHISPVPAPDVGERRLSQQWAFEPAYLAGAIAATKDGPMDLHPAYDVKEMSENLAGEQTFPVVFGGQGTAEDLDGLNIEDKLVLVAVPAADTAKPYIHASQNMDEAVARVKARGAAGLIGYLDVPEDGQRLPLCPCEDDHLHLGLDVGEGRALRAALAEGRVSVTLTPRTKADPVYRLRFDDEGAMPSGPERVRHRDLARLETHYHAAQEDAGGRELWETDTGEPAADLRLGARLSLPQTRTEYVGPPRPDLTWTRTMSGQDLDMVSQDRFLPARRLGKAREEHWFKAPLVPGSPELPAKSPALPVCTMCRDGDRFVPAEYWLDSDQGHFSRVVGPVYDTVPRLFRDGGEIPVEGRRPRSFRVPDGSASYRLEAEEETGWTLSEQVSTTWEFTSTPPSGTPDGYRCEFGDSCTVQPAVQFRYDLPLDLRNRAPAGRLFGFALHAGTNREAPGPQRVRDIGVEYSFDDGEHWWPAFVWPLGDGDHAVLVAHPPRSATSGFISLRVEADREGAFAGQTIKRAYALR